jgi:DNA-binding transcriptional LysR family regulator
MELRQLEHFIAVAEDESFTRAAARLGYVQSALSVSIQTLERELAVRLLDRTTHRVRLTDAGEALLPRARATLAAAAEVREEAAAINGVVRGRLRVGVMQSFSALNVPRLLGRFHREHPQVEITARPAMGGAAAILASLESGELDIAFVAVTEPHPSLRVTPLRSERLHLIARADAAPKSQRAIRLEQLAGASFVDFPAGWAIRTIVDRAFAELGASRHVGIEVGDVGTLVQLTREGLGVSVLPSSLLGADRRGLSRRPLSPALSWELSVVTRQEPRVSTATHALLELMSAD